MSLRSKAKNATVERQSEENPRIGIDEEVIVKQAAPTVAGCGRLGELDLKYKRIAIQGVVRCSFDVMALPPI